MVHPGYSFGNESHNSGQNSISRSCILFLLPFITATNYWKMEDFFLTLLVGKTRWDEGSSLSNLGYLYERERERWAWFDRHHNVGHSTGSQTDYKSSMGKCTKESSCSILYPNGCTCCRHKESIIH